MLDISVIKDIIVSIAAIIGSSVAIVGLGTWKRQLLGTSRHELANQLLVSVINTRNVVTEARNRGIYKFEFPNGDASANNEEENRSKLFHVYESRWRRVESALAEVEALIPRVEVHLSSATADSAAKFVKHIESLRNAFHEYLIELQNPGHWDSLGSLSQKYLSQIMDDNYAMEDIYKNELEKLITNIKKQITLTKF